jgi:hypothetical protein
MKNLIPQVQAELAELVLPHYKEDAFRTAFAGTALLNQWTVAEPSTGSAKPGQAAVNFLTWNPMAANPIVADKRFVPNNSGTKPDLRLIAPSSNKLYTVELKCGFTGSASHSNSNATRIAADIDLVAAGSRDLFAGLFDAGMLDRIQGGHSSRVKEMQQLLARKPGKPTSMERVHGKNRKHVYCRWKNGTDLKTTFYDVVCCAGVQLAMVVVRRANARF